MNDTVTVNYRGAFIDGTEFDNSAKSRQARAIPRRRRHSRLDGGDQPMKAGSKWQLFVPAGTGLWRAGQTRHSAQFRPDF